MESRLNYKNNAGGLRNSGSLGRMHGNYCHKKRKELGAWTKDDSVSFAFLRSWALNQLGQPFVQGGYSVAELFRRGQKTDDVVVVAV